MARNLSHNLKRMVAGLCAVMVVATQMIGPAGSSGLFSDSSIVASAEGAQQYEVSLGQVSDAGTVTVSENVDLPGRTYTATANPGYKFVKFVYYLGGQKESDSNTISFSYDEDAIVDNLKAVFVEGKEDSTYNVTAKTGLKSNGKAQALVKTTGEGGTLKYALLPGHRLPQTFARGEKNTLILSDLVVNDELVPESNSYANYIRLPEKYKSYTIDRTTYAAEYGINVYIDGGKLEISCSDGEDGVNLGSEYDALRITAIDETTGDVTFEPVKASEYDPDPTVVWSGDVPTGTDIGTYYVGWKVEEDDTYNGKPVSIVSVDIVDRDESTVNVTANTGLKYNGEAQDLVTATGEGGTIKYFTTKSEPVTVINSPDKLETIDQVVSGKTYTTNSTQGFKFPDGYKVRVFNDSTLIGTFEYAGGVYYRYNSTTGNFAIKGQSEETEIPGSALTVSSVDPTDKVIVVNVTDALTKFSNDAFDVNDPSETAPGDYNVYWYVDSDDNYKGKPLGMVKTSIAKADSTYNVTAKTGLTYDGEEQELVETTGAGGTISYAIAPDDESVSLDSLTWSEDIPTGTAVGSYDVYWKVDGGDNYNDKAPAKVTAKISGIEATITIKGKDFVVTDFKGKDVIDPTTPEGTDAVYKLNNGSYRIFSNETLVSRDDRFEMSRRDGSYYVDGRSFSHRYIVDLVDINNGDDVSDEITVEHVHEISVTTNTAKDAVVAECTGETGESITSATLAEFNIADSYYFGDYPTKDDVTIDNDNNFGYTASVSDFYFTEKGKTAKLQPSDMELGKQYTVNMYVTVKDDTREDIGIFLISKDVNCVPRPFNECTFKIGDTTLEVKSDDETGYYVEAPEKILTYNKQSQLPNVTVTAGASSTALVKDTDFVITSEGETKNAGAHTATIKAVSGSKAYDQTPVTVKFTIDKAQNEMSIAGIDRIYNGVALDTTLMDGTNDYTVTDPQGVLDEEGTVVSVPSPSTTYDRISAGKQVVEFNIKTPNYDDKTITVESNISKRDATVTPSFESQTIDFSKQYAPLTYTVEEENKDENTGVVAADKEKLGSDLLTFSGDKGNMTPVGEYTEYSIRSSAVSASPAKNYNFTVDNTDAPSITINKRALKLSMFDIGDCTFDNKEHSIPLTVEDIVDGVNVLKASDYVLSGTTKATNANGADGYKVTVNVSENSNYSLANPIELTWRIDPAAITGVTLAGQFENGKVYYNVDPEPNIVTSSGTFNPGAGAQATYYKLNDGATVPTTDEEIKACISQGNAEKVTKPTVLGTYIIKAAPESGTTNFVGEAYKVFEVEAAKLASVEVKTSYIKQSGGDEFVSPVFIAKDENGNDFDVSKIVVVKGADKTNVAESYNITVSDKSTLDDTTDDIKLVWDVKETGVSQMNAKAVNLDGAISISFKLNLPSFITEDKESYVEISREGYDPVIVKIDDSATVDANGRYVINYGVIPKEFADTVYVKVFNGEGVQIPMEDKENVDYTETGYPYSIKTYIENKKNDSNVNLRNVVNAMNDFYIAAQVSFKYGDYEGLDISDKAKAVTAEDLKAYEEVTNTTGALPDGFVKFTKALVLEEDTMIKVFINLANTKVDISKYNFKVDGKEVKPEYDSSSKRYYLLVKDIAAKELDIAHTFSIAYGENVHELTYSALSYAYAGMTKTADRVMISQSMYLYNQTSKEFFNN